MMEFLVNLVLLVLTAKKVSVQKESKVSPEGQVLKVIKAIQD